MKKNSFCLIVLTVLLITVACNMNGRSAGESGGAPEVGSVAAIVEDDISDFLAQAASGGLMEVQLGEMAEHNSKSVGVKNFGTMMVKDHGKANKELQRLASEKDIDLPAFIREEHQKHINELTPLRGPEFDEKYMDMMVNDHTGDIDLFEKASKFEDSAIREFANQTLPILRKHLEAAKKIKRNLEI